MNILFFTQVFSRFCRFDIMKSMPRAAKPPLGRRALFRKKVRAPVSITLTRDHHRRLNAAMARLGLTRADVLALLVDRYVDDLELSADNKK
jgi:hypothetical protein